MQLSLRKISMNEILIYVIWFWTGKPWIGTATRKIRLCYTCTHTHEFYWSSFSQNGIVLSAWSNRKIWGVNYYQLKYIKFKCVQHFVFGEANFCITWKLNHFFKNVNDFTWKILWNFFHLINFIENYQWSLHAIKVWVCYTSTNWEKTGGEIDAFNLYFEINEENYSSTWLLLPSILQIR